MKKLLIRELEEQIGGRHQAVLSVTILAANVTLDLFDSELSRVLAGTSKFERVHLVGLKQDTQKVLPWLGTAAEPGKRLRRVLPDLEQVSFLIEFDVRAEDFVVSSYSGVAVHLSDVVVAERRASLLDAFNHAGGMIEAQRGFHYKKTSGAHSSKFIRTANVLEQSENVALVALWLLPAIWKSSLEQVVVDTSGIYAPVIHAVNVRARLKGEATPLQVWSHQSFDGLEDLDAIEGKQTVFVISASTSGTLRAKLISRGADSTNVWTVFGLAPGGKVVGNTLCDLLGRPHFDRDGFDVIDNHKSDGCRLCKGGSLGVQISGDQFVLEPPRVTEVDILATDLTAETKNLFAELVGTGLFKAYRARSGRRGGLHDIYLDVRALFSMLNNTPQAQLSDFWKKFQRSWQTLQARACTFNVERIVCGSHAYSEELAHEIERAYMQFPGITVPRVLSQKELAGLQGSTGSGTIVVSSCIEDQQELMSIGRDLRNVQDSGTTWYIAPLVRGGAKEMPESIRRVAGYGEFGPGTFSIHYCLSLVLPDCAAPSAWETELQIVREIKEWAYRQSYQVPPDLIDRENLLMTGVGTGLNSKLFWPSPAGAELSLRKDFALVSTAKPFSQGDLYAIMSVVLQGLRVGKGKDRRLLYTPFARSVIAPRVFSKFNDGVIQAAILRAARDHELHYANCDDATSAAMLSILQSEIGEIKIGQGEALMEFVMAMLANRLTLQHAHMKQFCHDLLAASPPPILALSVQFLESTL